MDLVGGPECKVYRVLGEGFGTGLRLLQRLKNVGESRNKRSGYQRKLVLDYQGILFQVF